MTLWIDRDAYHLISFFFFFLFLFFSFWLLSVGPSVLVVPADGEEAGLLAAKGGNGGGFNTPSLAGTSR